MKSLLALALLSSVALAAPKASKKPEPTWYCFLAVDSNAQTVEACERTQVACEDGIVLHEFDPSKVHCFGTAKAAAFTIRHKSDSRLETLAVPEMKACQYFSQSMVNEDIDLVAGCKNIP